MAGIVYYICGHSIVVPTAGSWQSEVECPDCTVAKVMEQEKANEQD